MADLSIVIIALNEAHIIEKCLVAASQITDDIVVIDSGSEDATMAIAKKYTDKVYSEAWRGYGPTRNLGAEKAAHDWILSLDCDEVPDAQLIRVLAETELMNGHIYKLSFRSNFWGIWMKHGGLGNDHRRKLYQRSKHQWNDNKVHERLTDEQITPTLKLSGQIQHYNYDSKQDLCNKLDRYARLSAEDLIFKNKRPSILKILFAPSFRFFKTYFIQLGLLDGEAGWQYARESMRMVRKRYTYYHELMSKK